MVSFSRLDEPSVECILNSLPLADLLQCLLLCRSLGVHQVPRALHRRRHLGLLLCPAQPLGLRLWATIPLDASALGQFRAYQRQQQQQAQLDATSPGARRLPDDALLRLQARDLLVLSSLPASTSRALQETFPSPLSLTFVQCAVPVATTEQLILLLHSPWAASLQTLKLYLSQYPELGPLMMDTLQEEDLLLDYTFIAQWRAPARRIGWHGDAFHFTDRWRTDRVRYWQGQLEEGGASRSLLQLAAHRRQGDAQVRPILARLWATLSAGGCASLLRLRTLHLQTDVARWGAFDGPAVLYSVPDGPLAHRERRPFSRDEFLLRPGARLRQLTFHLDLVNSCQIEMERLLQGQLLLLSQEMTLAAEKGENTLGKIAWRTPLPFHLVDLLSQPQHQPFTRRFTHLTLAEVPDNPGAFNYAVPVLPHFQAMNDYYTHPRLPLFADYFPNLRSLDLRALGSYRLGTLLRLCPQLGQLRQLTLTWSNWPPGRTEMPGTTWRTLESLLQLTIYHIGAFRRHDALQGLFCRWQSAPAFPRLHTFTLHVLGHFPCEECQAEEREEEKVVTQGGATYATHLGVSSCKGTLSKALAGHCPLLKSFRVHSQRGGGGGKEKEDQFVPLSRQAQYHLWEGKLPEATRGAAVSPPPCKVLLLDAPTLDALGAEVQPGTGTENPLDPAMTMAYLDAGKWYQVAIQLTQRTGQETGQLDIQVHLDFVKRSSARARESLLSAWRERRHRDNRPLELSCLSAVSLSGHSSSSSFDPTSSLRDLPDCVSYQDSHLVHYLTSGRARPQVTFAFRVNALESQFWLEKQAWATRNLDGLLLRFSIFNSLGTLLATQVSCPFLVFWYGQAERNYRLASRLTAVAPSPWRKGKTGGLALSPLVAILRGPLAKLRGRGCCTPRDLLLLEEGHTYECLLYVVSHGTSDGTSEDALVTPMETILSLSGLSGRSQSDCGGGGSTAGAQEAASSPPPPPRLHLLPGGCLLNETVLDVYLEQPKQQKVRLLWRPLPGQPVQLGLRFRDTGDTACKQAQLKLMIQTCALREEGTIHLETSECEIRIVPEGGIKSASITSVEISNYYFEWEEKCEQCAPSSDT